MSKVKKGIKKGFKKVKNFVKKHWKTIAIVGIGLFTAGIGMAGGFSQFMTMAKAGTGFWGTVGSTLHAVGSTMWAGATGIAGTFGIGPGASGKFAAGAGIQGGTLLNTGLAQGMNLASSGSGVGASANVGTYMGPGSSFMGGGGSLFGGAASPVNPALAGASPLSNSAYAAKQGVSSSSLSGLGGPAASGYAGLSSATAPAGLGWKSAAAAAAVPALINTGGAYMMAKGEEEAAKPKALWGYDLEGGTGYDGWQPQMAQQRQTVTGPDGQQYEPDGMGGWRPVMGLQPVGLMELQGGFA